MKCWWFTFFMLLSACSKLDDYMLGKDNTPQPQHLSTFSEQFTFKERWHIGLGLKSYVHATLARYRGILYIVAPSGEVQARHAENGQLLWTVHTYATLSGKMACSQSIMILGTEDAHVLALRLQDGQQIWKKQVSGAVLATPVMVGQKVIVKTVNGAVYALDLKTGRRLWTVQHGTPELILKASSAPVVAPQFDSVLVGYADGQLDAMSLKTGRLLWQKGLIYGIGASDIERLVDIDADLILYRDLVLLASYQGIIGAFSLQTGNLVWQKKASVIHNMDLSQGSLYVSDVQDVVWSLEPQHGRVNWKQVHLKARGLTSPVWTICGIIVGDQTGLLHLLNSQDGSFLGRISVKGGMVTPPVVQGRHVWALSKLGTLYAFDLI